MTTRKQVFLLVVLGMIVAISIDEASGMPLFNGANRVGFYRLNDQLNTFGSTKKFFTENDAEELFNTRYSILYIQKRPGKNLILSQNDNQYEEMQSREDAQAAVIGQELFIEKYCPRLVPDERTMELAYKSHQQPYAIPPSKLTSSDRASGRRVLHELELGQGTGFEPGAPKAFMTTCAKLEYKFVNMKHLYYISQ